MPSPHIDIVRTTGPIPSLFGILSPASTVIVDESDNWIDGFHYDIGDARVDAVNTIITGGPQSTESVVAVANDSDLLLPYRPFLIETTFRASTMGLTPEQVAVRAKEALDLVTQKAVERELWTGDLAKQLTSHSAGNRYLTHEDAIDVTPVPGTGIRVGAAQALLEEAVNETNLGSAGVVHAPRSVADVMRQKPNEDGDTLKTPLGNTVVAGSGYLHTGPGGVMAPANHRWMFATGPVTVRLGFDDYKLLTKSQAVDTRRNTIEYTASRPAAVTWSTTDLYAVLVDLSLDYA
jgi:hypothetical protein